MCVPHLQVRLGEKEALDGLMAFFEGRAADLRALEYYQVSTEAEWGGAGALWGDAGIEGLVMVAWC